MPWWASAGIAAATASPKLIAPTIAPSPVTVTSLAATTALRRGVIRNVGTLVPWRNSPAIAAIPTPSSTIDVNALTAKVWWINASLLTPGAVLAVSALTAADSGAIATLTAMVILNQRVVVSLRISLWMSLFMAVPPREVSIAGRCVRDRRGARSDPAP